MCSSNSLVKTSEVSRNRSLSSRYLGAVVLCNERLLIVGDFKFHIDISSDGDGIKFLDILQSFCLEQHVVRPTHIDRRD